MKYEIRSHVTECKLTRNRNLLMEAIASFEGKDVIVKIEKAKKKRSNPQNAYMWGVVIPLMREALKESGHTMTNEMVHELLKLRFLKESILVNEETGECVERIKSTQELSTTQMMEYFIDIQKFAMEYFGVNIPDPNEDIKLNFE